MNTTQNVQFDVAGTLGGIINNGIKPGENKCLQCKPFVRRTVSMECFPLFSILQALGNPTVHYLGAHSVVLHYYCRVTLLG